MMLLCWLSCCPEGECAGLFPGCNVMQNALSVRAMRFVPTREQLATVFLIFLIFYKFDSAVVGSPLCSIHHPTSVPSYNVLKHHTRVHQQQQQQQQSSTTLKSCWTPPSSHTAHPRSLQSQHKQSPYHETTLAVPPPCQCATSCSS